MTQSLNIVFREILLTPLFQGSSVQAAHDSLQGQLVTIAVVFGILYLLLVLLLVGLALYIWRSENFSQLQSHL